MILTEIEQKQTHLRASHDSTETYGARHWSQEVARTRTSSLNMRARQRAYPGSRARCGSSTSFKSRLFPWSEMHGRKLPLGRPTLLANLQDNGSRARRSVALTAHTSGIENVLRISRTGERTLATTIYVPNDAATHIALTRLTALVRLELRPVWRSLGCRFLGVFESRI